MKNLFNIAATFIRVVVSTRKAAVEAIVASPILDDIADLAEETETAYRESSLPLALAEARRADQLGDQQLIEWAGTSKNHANARRVMSAIDTIQEGFTKKRAAPRKGSMVRQ